jgi:hypothetical protein
MLVYMEFLTFVNCHLCVHKYKCEVDQQRISILSLIVLVSVVEPEPEPEP